MTRVCLQNGRKLAYRDVGQGPVLVLLHGWAMSSGVFSDNVPALAKHFRLLIPDLPGHGLSDPGQDYTLSALAAVLKGWLDSLHIDDCYLLGWSFGGQLAMQLATDTELIKRMILVSSTPKFCQSADWDHGLPQTQVRTMQRQFQRDTSSTLDAFVGLMFAGEPDEAQRVVELCEQSVLPEVEAGCEVLKTLRIGDLREQLAKIAVPTMIQHGQRDGIIPVAAGTFLAEQIPNAEASLHADVGHAPFLSSPKQSQTLWKEFLL